MITERELGYLIADQLEVALRTQKDISPEWVRAIYADAPMPQSFTSGQSRGLGQITAGEVGGVLNLVTGFLGGKKKMKIPWIDSPVDITRDVVINAGPAGAVVRYPFARKTNYKNSYSGFQDGDIMLTEVLQSGRADGYGQGAKRAFLFLPGNKWSESEGNADDLHPALPGLVPMIKYTVSGGDRAALNSGMLSITSEFNSDFILGIKFGKADPVSGTYIPLTEQEWNAKFPNQAGAGVQSGEITLSQQTTAQKILPFAGIGAAALGVTALMNQ